jgi:Protein of unknown function (DUF2878)
MMRWRPIAEWIGFQLVWLTCAIGAAHGRNAPGVIAAALFIGAFLAMKEWSLSEIVTILASGVLGLLAESALASMELVRFAAPWPSPQLAPAWIVALWLSFGATLTTLGSLLGHQLVIKAGVVGFIAGPLAYWAGARLGALAIAGSPPFTYLAIALIWAVALPSLLRFRQCLRP